MKKYIRASQDARSREMVTPTEVDMTIEEFNSGDYQDTHYIDGQVVCEIPTSGGSPYIKYDKYLVGYDYNNKQVQLINRKSGKVLEKKDISPIDWCLDPDKYADSMVENRQDLEAHAGGAM